MNKLSLGGLREVAWETRNLGIPAFELDFDSLSFWSGRCLKSELSAEVGDAFFVQLRAPANNPAYTASAEGLGFRNAELAINPLIDLNNARLYQQYISDYTCIIPPGIDKNILSFDTQNVAEISDVTRKKIAKGSIESFRSDRFHTDPNCADGVADARIGMWLEEDLFTNPEMKCTTVFLKDNLVGYIIWRDSVLIVGAISPDFIGKGLAKLLYLQTMSNVHQISQTVTTTISANNIEVVNLYSRLEYSFRNPTQVYHLWGTPSQP